MSTPDAQQFQKSPRVHSIALPGDASQNLVSSLSAALDSAKSFLTGSTAQLAVGLLVVAVGYFVVAKTSLDLRLGGSTKAALWPSNAILVAALLLTPVRRWWMYLLAVVPAHIVVHWTYHIGALWLAFQIGHNTLLAATAAVVLKRWEPSLFSFDRLHDVLVFLGTAILAPGFAALALVTTVSNICSEETIRLHGWSLSFWRSLSRIWLTSTVSFLVFVPVMLLLVSRGRFL